MLLGKGKNKALQMRFFGDPVLGEKAKEITEINDEIRELAAGMIDLMYRKNGIGLAGNQVGVPLKIVVLHIDPPEDDDGNPLPLTSPGELILLPKMPLTLINPEIVSYSDEICDYEEGCLSVPKLYANVKRPASVVLKARLLDNSEIQLECAGLLARALQHELDHLDGIVYVQKADEEDYKKIEAGVEKIVRKNGPRNYKVKRLV